MTYNAETIQSVWEKGRVIAEQDPIVWRKDECGAWLRREHYGREDSEYGWKIENVSPGGPDTPQNLRPFHRQNAFDVGAGRAHCHVTADQKGVDPHEHLVESPRNHAIADTPGETI